MSSVLSCWFFGHEYKRRIGLAGRLSLLTGESTWEYECVKCGRTKRFFENVLSKKQLAELNGSRKKKRVVKK